jgi:hypothetical protein
VHSINQSINQVYAGDDVEFAPGETKLWIDNYGEANGVLEHFRDFFEDERYLKCWVSSVCLFVSFFVSLFVSFFVSFFVSLLVLFVPLFGSARVCSFLFCSVLLVCKPTLW